MKQELIDNENYSCNNDELNTIKEDPELSK